MESVCGPLVALEGRKMLFSRDKEEVVTCVAIGGSDDDRLASLPFARLCYSFWFIDVLDPFEVQGCSG